MPGKLRQNLHRHNKALANATPEQRLERMIEMQYEQGQQRIERLIRKGHTVEGYAISHLVDRVRERINDIIQREVPKIYPNAAEAATAQSALSDQAKLRLDTLESDLKDKYNQTQTAAPAQINLTEYKQQLGIPMSDVDFQREFNTPGSKINVMVNEMIAADVARTQIIELHSFMLQQDITRTAQEFQIALDEELEQRIAAIPNPVLADVVKRGGSIVVNGGILNAIADLYEAKQAEIKLWSPFMHASNAEKFMKSINNRQEVLQGMQKQLMDEYNAPGTGPAKRKMLDHLNDKATDHIKKSSGLSETYQAMNEDIVEEMIERSGVAPDDELGRSDVALQRALVNEQNAMIHERYQQRLMNRIQGASDQEIEQIYDQIESGVETWDVEKMEAVNKLEAAMTSKVERDKFSDSALDKINDFFENTLPLEEDRLLLSPEDLEKVERAELATGKVMNTLYELKNDELTDEQRLELNERLQGELGEAASATAVDSRFGEMNSYFTNLQKQSAALSARQVQPIPAPPPLPKPAPAPEAAKPPVPEAEQQAAKKARKEEQFKQTARVVPPPPSREEAMQQQKQRAATQTNPHTNSPLPPVVQKAIKSMETARAKTQDPDAIKKLNSTISDLKSGSSNVRVIDASDPSKLSKQDRKIALDALKQASNSLKGDKNKSAKASIDKTIRQIEKGKPASDAKLAEKVNKRSSHSQGIDQQRVAKRQQQLEQQQLEQQQAQQQQPTHSSYNP